MTLPILGALVHDPDLLREAYLCQGEREACQKPLRSPVGFAYFAALSAPHSADRFAPL